MENFLTVASDARAKYHNILAAISELADRDYERSLESWEMKRVHNAWMNDVQSWMLPRSLEDYELLRGAAQPAKGKGKRQRGAEQPAKGQGKHQRGAAQPAQGQAKGKKGAAQPAKGQAKGKRGAGQAAQELKKKGFNAFCFQFIGSKAMLMCAVQHPCAFKTARGLRRILDDLAQAHESAEYQQLLGNSEKKSAEEKQLKDQRDYAVKELMRGKAANRAGRNPELALQYRDGMRVGSMTVLHNLSIGEGGRIP